MQQDKRRAERRLKEREGLVPLNTNWMIFTWEYSNSRAFCSGRVDITKFIYNVNHNTQTTPEPMVHPYTHTHAHTHPRAFPLHIHTRITSTPRHPRGDVAMADGRGDFYRLSAMVLSNDDSAMAKATKGVSGERKSRVKDDFPVRPNWISGGNCTRTRTRNGEWRAERRQDG